MLFDELTQLLDPEPHRGSLNMAIDEILLRRTTRPLLRVYRWTHPAVSFGYFGCYDAVAARWKTEELVRRWTGGGEVLHGSDCTYTLIVPRAHPFSRISAIESYRAIHQALALLIAEGRLAESADRKISDACFDHPVQFDLIVDRHKVAGAAQRRTAQGLLHQGSINHPAAMTPDCAERLAAVFAARSFEEPISGELLAAARVLEKTKYGAEVWLRRFVSAASRAKESLAR